MGFTTLGLMLGYGCNARCRSCLWGELPKHGARMSVEEACTWVDQAYALGSLLLIGFSGGEPFLYLNDMKAVSRYAGEKYGLPSVSATNCFWAVTPKKAEAILGSLYGLGLRRLLISVDDFHQEWIPLERVQNCLNAARMMGIACTLQCVVTASSHKLDFYLAQLGVNKDEGIEASEIQCTPVGSAATRVPASEFPTHPGVPADYCTMLQALIVRPEGMVHLCCGPSFTIEPLTVGNLREESLKSMLERAEWDPLLNALALGNGPSLLAAPLAEAGLSDCLRDNYVSSCHACHHILSQPDVAALLSEKLEPQRAELFLKRTILDQIAGDRTADLLKI